MAKSKKPAGPGRTGYRVGYGKPPKHSRFKKGVSGNPTGRRPGSRNRVALLRQAARRQATVTVSGRPRPISRAQAVLLGLAAKAHAGDPNAMIRLLSLLDQMEGRTRYVPRVAR